MHYYKATLQYDGTNYCGFQWQKDIPSIQNDLNIALENLLQGKVTTVGASRTDTGVHAFEQVMKITTENPFDESIILSKLNQIVSPQIRCLAINSCPGSFNPITSHASKEYRYFFTNVLESRGDQHRFMANNPYNLNIELMKKCTEKIVGPHDFRHFVSMGSNVKTTVRKILECELTEVNPHAILNSSLFPIPNDTERCYQFRIVATGFLKQMVRHLMSALWRVGNGTLSEEEFLHLLSAQDFPGNRRWKVATPRGLFLYKLNS